MILDAHLRCAASASQIDLCDEARTTRNEGGSRDEQSHISNWRFAERPRSGNVGAADVPAPPAYGLFHSLAYSHRATHLRTDKIKRKAQASRASRAVPS